MQKDCGPTVLTGLVVAFHSGTLSHYCLPRELLAAGFHPWPGSSLLSQPECQGLLHGTHIDGKLSADVPSTWTGPPHRTPGFRPFHNPTSQKRDYRRCQPSSHYNGTCIAYINWMNAETCGTHSRWRSGKRLHFRA